MAPSTVKEDRGKTRKKAGFSLRRLISLSTFLSFIGLGATGIALFTAPPGRIARWGDWRFAGLGKSTYEDIHIVLAAFFLIAGALHLYFNWAAFVSYLRNTAKRLVLFTREFTAAFAITLFLVFSALWVFPPGSYLFDFEGFFEQRHEREIGSPPFGRAEEATLSEIASRLDLDRGRAAAALREEGFVVPDPSLSLHEIGRASGKSPASIYAALVRVADDRDEKSPARRKKGKGEENES